MSSAPSAGNRKVSAGNSKVSAGNSNVSAGNNNVSAGNSKVSALPRGWPDLAGQIWLAIFAAVISQKIATVGVLAEIRGRWSIISQLDRTEPVDGLTESLFEADLGFPAQFGLGQRNVGASTRGVV